MINKYFNRRFKTLWGVKLAIAIKRPYDWVRLRLKGEKILSQNYSFFNHGSVSKIKDVNGKILNPGGYTIANLIWTQSMIDDINSLDLESELAETLKDEINEPTRN